MMQRFMQTILLILFVSFLASCDLTVEMKGLEDSVTRIDELVETDNFRPGSLEHILEGELNNRGQAVGFHYDKLPSKKGEIISGTKSRPNEDGIYEAKVVIEGTEKKSNRGMSTFFPDEWDSQDVVDAINEAHEKRQFISGNTYEGLTKDGIIIRMYLDQEDKIISAFPIY